MHLFHPDDLELVHQHLGSVCAVQPNHESTQVFSIQYRFKHADGHWIWCLSQDSIYEYDHQGAPATMIGSFIDISALKRQEAAVMQLSRQYEHTFSSAPVGIAHTSLTGKVLKVNPQLCSILESKAIDITNRYITDFFYVYEQNTDIASKLVLGINNSVTKNFEQRLISDNGRISWTKIQLSIVPEDIEPSYVIWIIDDITERKEIEQQLESSNASLERFAYSASHDLQEPLRKISMFTDIIAEKLADQVDSQTQYELERVTDAAKRMRDMITALMELSRLSSSYLSYETTSFSAISEIALENIAPLVQESGLQVTIKQDADLLVDVSAFCHVVQNLYTNSIRHCQNSVTPQVSVSCRQSNGNLVIRVCDNGMGIPEPYLKRIFEPFKRFNGIDSSGQGIGLAICSRIIERHGGRIKAEKQSPGSGACFVIELPMHPQREL